MSEVQRFSFRTGLGEVVPEALSMAAVVGDTISVGVVAFRLPGGPGIAPKAHAHGEEITLQITGGCSVLLGDDPSRPEGALELEAGSLMLMPAEQPHSGLNRYDAAGACLRLNVVSPPRAEYGAKGAAQTYYPGAEDRPGTEGGKP